MSKHVDIQPLNIETEYSADWFFPRQKKINQEDDAGSDSQKWSSVSGTQEVTFSKQHVTNMYQ